MTKLQRACLEKALRDGTIIESGLDHSGIDTRVLNACIRKGWLKYTSGPLHPYIAAYWVLTDAGKEMLK